MIVKINQLRLFTALVLSGLLYGCSGSTTPDVERPMEEIEAELAPAEGQ